MTVKLKQPVLHPDGTVTTIAALLDQGRAKLTHSAHFLGRRGQPHDAYFAELTDAPGSWEIGKLAYLSRTGRREEINVEL